jgi:tetratricopeptide (TPR) repeat protein
MRIRHFYSILLVTVFFHFTQAEPGIAQQKDAKKWYKQAEAAKSLDEKISLFQKAISLDPSYAEAYYELGVAHAQRAELDQAMENLGRALFARPTNLAEALRHKIVFEIGKIQAQQGRYNEAKESLIGALNLAANKAERVLVLQAFARILVEAQFFEEAISRYEELLQLDNKNKPQYAEALQEARRLQAIDEIYQQGLTYLKGHRFQNAIESFEKVVSQESKFRDVENRLNEARQQLGTIQANERAFHSSTSEPKVSTTQQLANQISSAARLTSTASGTEQQILEKGLQSMKNEAWHEALQAFETVLRLNPANLVAADMIRQVQEALENSMENRIVQKYYSQGLAYLKDNNWVNAIISFEKVLSLNPGHSNAKENLSRAQAGLDLAGLESAKQRYYEQGMQAIQNQDWIFAESLFNKLLSLDDQYRDVKTQMHFVQDKLALLNQDSELVRLYQDGENHIRNGRWQDAVTILTQVSAQNASFRDVQIKLQFVQEQLARVRQAERISQKIFFKTFWFWLVLSLAFGTMGFLLYNPAIRGRLLLMLGLHGKSGKLYERLIDNGGMSDRLCLDLLHLYLSESQKDTLAIKVFERALRLQLLQDEKVREEVSAIVTRHYLGNWESEARQIDEKMAKILGT